MNLPPFPNHLDRTARRWKARKRRELRAIRKAVESFRSGCAYTPVYDENKWDEFEYTLRQFEHALSAKQWGR